VVVLGGQRRSKLVGMYISTKSSDPASGGSFAANTCALVRMGRCGSAKTAPTGHHPRGTTLSIHNKDISASNHRVQPDERAAAGAAGTARLPPPSSPACSCSTTWPGAPIGRLAGKLGAVLLRWGGHLWAR